MAPLIEPMPLWMIELERGMQRVTFEGGAATYFDEGDGDGRPWPFGSQSLRLQLSSWQLVTSATSSTTRSDLDRPIREIRGSAELVGKKVGGLPDGGAGPADVFEMIDVSIYEGINPIAAEVDVNGPIYLGYWPAIHEFAYAGPAHLSLGLTLEPLAFALYWEALQQPTVGKLDLSIELSSLSGRASADGKTWEPSNSSWADTLFIREGATSDVKLTRCEVRLSSMARSGISATACAKVALALAPKAPENSNLSRALNEGVSSLASKSYGGGSVQALHEEAREFAAFVRDLRWRLDHSPYDPNSEPTASLVR